jgi:hypothetical protein
MSTTGSPDGTADPTSDVAAALREAAFVRLVAAADGDALAALGVLADTLGAAGTPFQATVTPLPEPADRATDVDLTLALGRPAAAADATLGVDGVASSATHEVAGELGPPGFDPDAVLATAGALAAETVPADLAAPVEEAGLEHRPGLAGPTDDPVDALAHSTLLCAPVSGDPEAAADLLGDVETADMDDDARRRVASLAALVVAGDADGTSRGAEAVERFLRPYAGGPFGTLGGYGDVLDALARTRPGLGVAVALGAGDGEAALSAWREHGRRAHRAVGAARTGRYDGLFAVRCDGDVPAGTVARLVRDFRSPEPVVLVVADGEAAAVRTPEASLDVGTAMAAAAETVAGTGGGTTTRGRAVFEAEDSAFVVAFREAQ